jgi:MFS transporter, DHA1 family, multidrug resistance protein
MNSTRWIVAIVIITAMLGGSAFDFHLPVVPQLPELIGASVVEAQWTLAGFSFGFAFSMLLFGALGDLYSRRAVLLGGLGIFVPASVLCAFATTPEWLIAGRVLQGCAAAAGNSLAPALIRSLYDEARSVRAMSIFSSIFSLVPVIAPALGALMIAAFGWHSIFWLLAGIGLLLVPAVALSVPRDRPTSHDTDLWAVVRGYGELFRFPRYLAYTGSQAMGFGGLITFVLSSPYLITAHLGGDTNAFLMTQVIIITAYVLGANGTGLLVHHVSTGTFILAGSIFQIVGGAALLGYAWFVTEPGWIAVALIVAIFDAGHGIRSGAGFTKAIDIVPTHAARASSLLNFMCVATAGAGAALVAPFLATQGVLPAAIATFVMGCSSLVLLLVARKLEARHASS